MKTLLILFSIATLASSKAYLHEHVSTDSFDIEIHLSKISNDSFDIDIQLSKISTDTFDIDTELSKISNWTCQEHMALWNNVFGCSFVIRHNTDLMKAAAMQIGNQEMRTLFGLSKPPWLTRDCFDERKELRTQYGPMEIRMMHFDALENLEETVLNGAVDFLDRHDPVIRSVFKHTFAEVRKKHPYVHDWKVFSNNTEIYQIYENIYETMDAALTAVQHGYCEKESRRMDSFSLLDPECLMMVGIEKFQKTNIPPETCLRSQETDSLLWGRNFFKPSFSSTLSFFLFSEISHNIIVQELRSALDLNPSHPFLNKDFRMPTKEELDAATTVEEYMTLGLYKRSKPFCDDDIAPTRTIDEAFIDEHFPEFRSGQKKRFQKVRQENGGWLDRNTVDRMVRSYRENRYSDNNFHNCIIIHTYLERVVFK